MDTASSGAEAIEAIRQRKVTYSAVFMDHMMPEMDGIEAARIIREEIGTEYARKLPLIMLTANAIVGNEEMFLSKGFDAFISKPIDSVHLDSAIRRWVRDKDLEKALEQEGKADNIEMAPEQTINAGGGERTRGPDARGAIESSPGLAESHSSLAQWNIDGLDIAAALERFGDEDVLREILEVFVSDTPALLDKIRDVTPEGLQEYAVTVHGIKGSCRGVSAESLGNRAESLERKAQEGNFNYIQERNAAFISDIEALLANLGDKLKAGERGAKKKAPDKGALSDLLEASKSFDVRGVATAMAELEKYEYESGGELVQWIREKLKTMSLGEIEERLTRY